MHKKNSFICVVEVPIVNLKGKKRSVLSKNMTNTFGNSKSYRKQKLCVNVQQKYRKYVVLAVNVCFAYFKSKDTIECYPTDSNSAHPNYVETSGKNLHSNVEQSSMFHISAQAKYTHFQKRLQYSLF